MTILPLPSFILILPPSPRSFSTHTKAASPEDAFFYAGNGRVARLIGAPAAKLLMPCTLELGGNFQIILDDNIAFVEEDDTIGRAVEGVARWDDTGQLKSWKPNEISQPRDGPEGKEVDGHKAERTGRSGEGSWIEGFVAV
ncbi:hypothetical protein BDQ12DRAFT_727157 [Crucibulum laeve]|uniref:Uncharacterized protein n=1 Tax=Crucibulum laeve TaxID=68775 RepID=A0A5C3LMK6_9AGAR|nr:hypothetical protein BDQ12DRAFT_727157 [Crucibulum laeve]